MWAARKDEQAEAVNELISAGADMNLENREVLAIHNHLRCMLCNYRSCFQGKTALMLAAECGCAKNVSLILATQAQDTDSEAKGVINLDLKDNKVVINMQCDNYQYACSN